MSAERCVAGDCERPVKYRGMCNTHGERVRRNGSLHLTPRPTLAERLWSRVEKTDGCWIWTATKNNHGYGQIGLGTRVLMTHRVAYELVKGPIPEGLDLDHLCRTPACCRPDHLEAVTHRENMRRGKWGMATHCPHGHPYAGANLYVTPRGGRRCRICAIDRKRRLAQGAQPRC